MNELGHSRLLFRSLVQSPLLFQHLGGFSAFDQTRLCLSPQSSLLNFNQKLGHLYEDALECLLKQSETIELIAKSIQLFEPLAGGGRKTVGELDFLIKVEDKPIHLELAVKFYLGVDTAQGVHWPGPDARDCWERKRQHMIDHQLAMGSLPLARQHVSDGYGIDDFETQHLVYGCFFDPFECGPLEVVDLSADAVRGQWVSDTQLMSSVFDGSLWLLPKHLWPCCVDDTLLKLLAEVSRAELITASQSRCVMFTDGSNKYFLVSPQWRETVEAIEQRER